MKKIEITEEEFKRLTEDSQFLRILIKLGVTSWEDYERAIEIWERNSRNKWKLK